MSQHTDEAFKRYMRGEACNLIDELGFPENTDILRRFLTIALIRVYSLGVTSMDSKWEKATKDFINSIREELDENDNIAIQ